MKLVSALAALTLLLTACSGGTSGDAESAADAAKRVQTKAGGISKIVPITEDNDPNGLIGRPGGYTAAAVLYDAAATCTDLGAECGATIEQYATAKEAKARADYLASVAESSPIFAEYDTLDGALLLRVPGATEPSRAKELAAAFTGD